MKGVLERIYTRLVPHRCNIDIITGEYEKNPMENEHFKFSGIDNTGQDRIISTSLVQSVRRDPDKFVIQTLYSTYYLFFK